MRILVTNDDGISANGLEALCSIARELTDDVWVVAPETNQSGVSHAITLHHPIRMRKIEEKRFSIQGTPTDCVLMGVEEILGDTKPDLVLSGVNRGQNMGDDVTYSGTIAGAMEGAILGIPSIALSQYINFAEGGRPNWEISKTHGAGVIRKLIDKGWPKNVLMNINFPDRAPEEIEGVAVTRQGHRDGNLRKVDARQDTHGLNYYWYDFRRAPLNLVEGTDIWAVHSGLISVTPLSLNLTHDSTFDDLNKTFLE